MCENLHALYAYLLISGYMRAYRIEITAVLNDFELKLFNPMSFVEATTDLCNIDPCLSYVQNRQPVPAV